MIVGVLVGAVALTWGLTYVVLRVGMQASPPFFFAAARTILGGLLIVATALALRRRFPLDLRAHGLLALGGVLNYSMFYGGLNYGVLHLPAGLTALLNYTAPFWIAGLARAFLGQPLGPQRISGLVAGFFGVVLIVSDRLFVGFDPMWEAQAAVLLAAFAWGAGSVFFVRYNSGVPLEWAVGLQSLYGSLPLAILWLIAEASGLPDPTWSFWGALAFSVLLSSFLAQLAFFSLLRRREATIVGTYMFLVPAVASVSGFVILHESFTLVSALGGVAVIGGIYLVNQTDKWSFSK